MALTFGRSTEPGDQWRNSADTHFEHHRVGADSIACLQPKTRAAFGHNMEGITFSSITLAFTMENSAKLPRTLPRQLVFAARPHRAISVGTAMERAPFFPTARTAKKWLSVDTPFNTVSPAAVVKS